MNGKKKNWFVGREFCVWGLPLGKHSRFDAENLLTKLGLNPDIFFVAISGPRAHFLGKITEKNGIYFSEHKLFHTVNDNIKESYPIRINFSVIMELNSDWYTGHRGYSWKQLLNDVYFSMNSLFVLRKNAYTNKYFYKTIIDINR
jgi:hypothetical protein